MITLYPKIAITTSGPHIAAYVGGTWVDRAIAVGTYTFAGLISSINAALAGTGGAVQSVDGDRRVKNSGSVPLAISNGPEWMKIAKALGWYYYSEFNAYVLPLGSSVLPGVTPPGVSFLQVPLPPYAGLAYDGPADTGTRYDRGVFAASDAGMVAAIATASRYDAELTLTGVPAAAVGGPDAGGDSLTWIPQVLYALSPGWRGTALFAINDGSKTWAVSLRELIGPDDLEPMGELRQYWRIRLRVCQEE